MYHKQLVNHVATKMQAGLTRDQIIEELLRDGWTGDDIEEALYYNAYPEKLKHFSFKRIFHSEVPTSLMVTLIVFILIIGGGLIYLVSGRALNYNIFLQGTPQAKAITFSYGEQPALSSPEFFNKTKNQFIADKASFIEADLSAMTLRVYKAGAMTLEVPISSKGKEGSWWETPAGLYKVNTKEKAHYSTMGHVWMPWSMNFQGNFFIHGRTYHDDGTLSSAQFTGGCIRLLTDDAEKVFTMIDVGTPVLVFEKSFSSDDYTYADAGPTIPATAYLSADLRNNHIFSSKDSSKEVAIASLTKLMTALIATEYINLDASTIVPSAAIVPTSKPRLKAGMKISMYQLLFPLLMESSNEAAEAIARYSSREVFIQHMNDKAASIGMTHTHFVDVSGASAGNVSTADDLFMLAKYIYNNRSFIFNITSGKVKSSAYGTSDFSDLGNFNDFVDNEYFFGGKNGKSTAALDTSLSVFELPIPQGKRPIVIIILGSQNRKPDAETLLNYTLNHFR